MNRILSKIIKQVHRNQSGILISNKELIRVQKYKNGPIVPNLQIPRQICKIKRYYQTSPSLVDSSDSQIEDAVKKFRSEHQIFVNNVDEESSKNIFQFNELDMPEKLHEIMATLGYQEPTPIQAQSLPILFSGRDLIGIAQTGSGKTLAYLLPAFKKFFSVHRNYWSNADNQQKINPQALILAPTRELAVQIFEVIRQFRIFKSICLYGGNDRRKQIHFLENNNPLFLVSTPGRLKDLIDSQFVDLSEINYLVVDEADRMLDMGFEPQISYLIERCPDRFNRQTMMFSASWPDEVKSFVSKYLKPDHAFISIGGTKLVANHNIEQKIIVCDPYKRFDFLEEIFKKHSNEKTLVFCNTKHDCDKIASIIRRKFGIRSSALHGDMTQRQRESALKDFKLGELKTLCATNVAARGLDINEINVVINYDLPTDIETYVHRIGRTGRKDNKGTAYSFFVDRSNRTLAKNLIEILRESNNDVPEELLEISTIRRSMGTNLKKKFNNNYYGNKQYGGRYQDQEYRDNNQRRYRY